MKIGILCACAPEFAPFESRVSGIKRAHRGLIALEGELCGKKVCVLFCGLGKVNAAIGAEILIRDFGADAVIMSGTCGALAPGLHIGDAVMVTEAVYHDLDAQLMASYHPCPIDGVFKCGSALIGAARDLPLRFGRAVTGDQFITDEGRDSIISRFSPLVCDMETAAAAQMCAILGVPFNAVRSVSDTKDEAGLGSFEKNVALASEKSCDIVCKILNAQ